MTDDLTNVLVRGRSINLETEYGAVIVNEIIRRDVTYKLVTAATGDVNDHTAPGIALLGDGIAGSPHNLEPIARYISKIVVTIERLPEFLYIPVNAHRDPMVGLWTIEAVPLTSWFRHIIKTDAQVLREAGMK